MNSITLYTALSLRHENKILLARRVPQSKRFPGFYGLIGGKMEPDESILECLIREVAEEIGIIISKEDLVFVGVSNECICLSAGMSVGALAKSEALAKEELRYQIGFHFTASVWQGEIINKEPHAHDELTWFTFDAIPENITPGTRNALGMMLDGTHFVESVNTI